LFAALSALVTLACVAASARRLVLVTGLTRFEPGALERALFAAKDAAAARAMRRALAAIAERDAQSGAEPPWECELFDAALAPADTRVFALNEALSDLDYRVQRWSRVPRACTSIASSAAFLFASLALRDALAAPGTPDLGANVDDAILAAVGIVVAGLAGSVFCLVTHVRAGAIVKQRLAAIDRLVGRLEKSSVTAESARAPTFSPSGAALEEASSRPSLASGR
jgi:hypothetical protein